MRTQQIEKSQKKNLSPPISHLASTFPFSPLRKEPFLLCLSQCVVLGVVLFPPLEKSFSHRADETFAHWPVWAFSHQMAAETLSHQ